MDGLAAWAETIKSLDVQKMDTECLEGLHMMLKLASFSSLKQLIKDKLKEHNQEKDKQLKALQKKSDEISDKRIQAVGNAKVYIKHKRTIQQLSVNDIITIHNHNLDKEIQIVPCDLNGNFLKPIKVTLKQLIIEVNNALPQ